MLGKLYLITLVTSLNSRLRIVNSRSDNSTDIISSFRVGVSGESRDNTQAGRMLGIGSGRSGGQVVTINNEGEVRRHDIQMDCLEVSSSP